MSLQETPEEFCRIECEELKDFVRRSFEAAGVSKKHSSIAADILVEADYRGIHSHGTNRLEMYLSEIQNKTTSVSEEPAVEHQSTSVATVDGKNCLGFVVGHFSMSLAISLAKSTGVGIVTAHHSNHFGMAGYYASLAAAQGLIGLAFTNTSPLVFPTRSAKAELGTNPISFYAPSSLKRSVPISPSSSQTTEEADNYELDMATSTVPIGKVEYVRRKGGQTPTGWGCDKNGAATNSPKEILDGGGLLPLGGVEETAGYKGAGLAMAVEIMCGILSGSNYGGHVPPWRRGTRNSPNVGQCFIAISPAHFHQQPNPQGRSDFFEKRMATFMNEIRHLPTTQKTKKGETVLVAGDPEKAKVAEYRRQGVMLHENLVRALDKVAERQGIRKLVLQKGGKVGAKL